MSEYLTGKTAVVTGASRGFGRAMSIALAREGVRVALVGRDAAKLNETAGMAPGSVPFIADVTSEAAVLQLEKDVAERFGAVQILINNAGMNLRKPLTEFTLEEWRLVMDTNVTSAFLCSRAFIPHMKGRGYGRILFLTSTMSHVSLPERSAYSSSKTALLGMTKALALELAPEQITVNGISAGPFPTEMNTALVNDPVRSAQWLTRCPLGRWGDVDDIGSLAVYLCSKEASFITGTDVVIDGGWIAQ